jgi:hypothetical protein
MGLCAAGPNHAQQSIGVISTVSHDVAALEAIQQMRCCSQITSLPGGQHQPDRQTVLIDNLVHFGAQSSTRTADGVIFATFLPPRGTLVSPDYRIVDQHHRMRRSRRQSLENSRPNARLGPAIEAV